jgi:hypothetical protein
MQRDKTVTKLQITFIPLTEMHSRPSLVLPLANQATTLFSCFLLTQCRAQYGSGLAKLMLSYRIVSLAQIGICSEIYPITLKFTTSVTSFINVCAVKEA